MILTQSTKVTTTTMPLHRTSSTSSTTSSSSSSSSSSNYSYSSVLPEYGSWYNIPETSIGDSYHQQSQASCYKRYAMDEYCSMKTWYTDDKINTRKEGENHQPACSSYSWFNNGWMCMIVATLVMSATSFYLGTRSERFQQQHMPSSLSIDTRDELLLNQEQLLLSLAKERNQNAVLRHRRQRTIKDNQGDEAEIHNDDEGAVDRRHQHADDVEDEETNEEIDPEGSKGANGKNDEKLLRHIELLKQELEGKMEALRNETSRRLEVEEELSNTWKSYELYNAELAEEEEYLRSDLTRLMDLSVRRSFGAGPHYVEFKVSMPGAGMLQGDNDHSDRDNNETSTFEYFTIAMAALDLAPATIYVFLRQVEAGLWDGTSFYVNAPHILLAHPESASSSLRHSTSGGVDGSGDGWRGQIVSTEPAMAAQGIARVPIKEYSHRFPHLLYTVGMLNHERPGPSFYINKGNNVRNHAGEPCFGMVLVGREVVHKMFEIKNPHSDIDHYIPPVEIVSARILDRLEDAVGGQQFVDRYSLRDEM